MKKNDRLRTGDSALVRQINLSVIMNNLRKKAPISRAGLAQATGLNKTTVSSLVDELLQRQFVREIGSTTAGKDTRQLCWTSTRGGFIVGCEINVDYSGGMHQFRPGDHLASKNIRIQVWARGDTRSGAGTFERSN
jgi:hypothetical protein